MTKEHQASPNNASVSSRQQKQKDRLSKNLNSTVVEPQQLSLSSNHSKQAPMKSSATKTSDNVDSNQSTPDSSQTDSPTKSTPNKSARNKRKNDAKKRNANLKKQQQQQQPQAATVVSHDKLASDVAANKASPSKDDGKESSTSPIPSSDFKGSQREENVTLDKGLSNTNELTNSMDQKSDKIPKQDSDPDSRLKQGNDKGQVDSKLPSKSVVTTSNSQNGSATDKITLETSFWNRKQRENRELKEQLKLRDAQLQNSVDKIKQQIVKIKELEASLVSTTRTCNQFEKLVQQELSRRTRAESENESLSQTLTRLKNQIVVLEKDKSVNNELIRTLNATLMERETEVSILKLKMTRLQTTQQSNGILPPSTPSKLAPSFKQADPARVYALTGRSNSEFNRNSYGRSTMIAESTLSTRSSTSQLQHISSSDRDASIWARVPEELTPSKRPLLLDKSFNQPPFNCDPNQSSLNDPYSSLKSQQKQSSTPLSRESRLYKTLPKSMKSPEDPKPVQASNDTGPAKSSKDSTVQQEHDNLNVSMSQCLVTNLDESNSTNQSSGGSKLADGVADSSRGSKDDVGQKKTNDEPHYSTISESDLKSNKSV